MSTPSYEYQELDEAERERIISQRLRALEQEHFTLGLREVELAGEPEELAGIIEARKRYDARIKALRKSKPPRPPQSGGK